MLDLNQRIDALDEVLTARLHRHPQAKILTSLPGIGVLLAAEFLWLWGIWPACQRQPPGRLRRIWRRSGGIRVAAATPCAGPSATTASCCGSLPLRADQRAASRPLADYYQHKRREGKGHVQAVLALARRRVSVLWALLRDNRPFTPVPPAERAAA